MKKHRKNTFYFGEFYQRLTGNGRTVLPYLLLLTVFCTGLGLIIFFNAERKFLLFAGCILLYSFLGTLHILFTQRKFYFLNFTFYQEPVFFTLIPVIVASTALAYLYGAYTELSPFLVIAYCCAFLFPCLLILSWQAFRAIPEKVFRTWSLTDSHGYHDVPATLENKMRIKFKLSRNPNIPEELFSFNVSRQVTLGNFFFSVINSYKEDGEDAIAYLDEEKKPYEWQFYIERLRGLKKIYLNPARSLRRNNIREGDIIIARRLMA